MFIPIQCFLKNISFINHCSFPSLVSLGKQPMKKALPDKLFSTGFDNLFSVKSHAMRLLIEWCDSVSHSEEDTII